jgi:UDP-N-acetylglucosamine 2-epimerase
VGRLIAAMGTLGREMAALPEVKGDVVMGDAGGLQEESAEVQAPVQAQSQPQQSTAGKKKKKGKK